MKHIYLWLISLLLLLTACDNQQVGLLTRQVDSLRMENENLKAEIFKYQIAPDNLLLQIEDLYKNKQYDSIDSLYKLLKKYHPTSESTQRAEIIAINTIKAIERQQKEERLAIEKKKQERLRAVNRLKKEYDEIQKITWYEQPYFTHYNNTNYTSVYMGQTDDKLWLILKMSYCGDDWIFFDTAYLFYDDVTVNIPFDEYQNKKTEIGYGGQVWEWINVSVSEQLLQHLRKLSNAKNVKMRLSGKYTQTRNLTKNEVHGIKDILLAYDVLRGEQLLKDERNTIIIVDQQCVIFDENLPYYSRIWTPNQFTKSQLQEFLKNCPYKDRQCLYFTSILDDTGESDYAVIWPQKGQLIYYDK